ncbi:MAG: glycoside hydrolase family 3 N-terminal domain-containing protein, partial [Bacteroidota bacterium]
VLQDIFAGMIFKRLLFPLSFIFLLQFSHAQVKLPPFFSPASEHFADSLLKRMSPDERNGQLFMVAAWSNKDSAHIKELEWLIAQHGIGGLIFFQGGPVREALMTNHYQSISKIPLLIGMDAEWGIAMRLDSTIRFPRQMTIAAMHEDSLVYKMGAEIARQCRRLGIHINFAPDADINNNMQNPIIGSRAFSDDRETVLRNSLLYMNGLQDGQVLATAKHFPGHGNTDADSHFTLPLVKSDSAELYSNELYPFKALADSGIGSIMVAHLSVPALDTIRDHPSTLSKKIVTGLLKDQMNFKGIVFTDALNMKGVSSCYKPGVLDKLALLSGNDVLLYSEDVPTALKEIHLAVENCEITQAEIDSRVRKILMLKYWVGLQHFIPIDTTNIYTDLNSTYAQGLQQMMYEKSVTILSNSDSIIPVRWMDSLRIASVVIGDRKNNPFQEKILEYTPCEQYAIEKNEAVDVFESVKKYLVNHDLVILSIHGTNMKSEKNFGITAQEEKFIDEVINSYPTILVDFGNAYTLTRFKNINKAKAVVLAYEDTPLMHVATAQVLFGGASASGKIPIFSTPAFAKNSGETTNGPIRMKAAFPQDAGMDPEKLSRIDSIVKVAIAAGAMPGCQVLVARDQKIVFNKAFGTHSYEDTTAVNNTDLYDIASISKIAGTALATMKLFDEGKIDLNKPLSKYLPALKKSDKKSLIIREVLAHQAGLKSWIPFWKETMTGSKLNGSIYHRTSSGDFPIRVADSVYMNKAYSDSIFKWILESPLTEKGKYVYSDLGPILMKALVEKVSGQKLDDYLEANFYRPLGLSRLTYLPSEKFSPEEIIPTENDTAFRHQLLHGDVHDPAAAMMGGVSGNAGIFSDAKDLAVVMQMLLNNGTYGGRQFLQPNTIEIFTKQQFIQNKNRRGLFFDKPEPDPKKTSPTCAGASLLTFGHQGFTGTCVWVDPQYKLIYIFLSNRVCPDASNEKLGKFNVRTNVQQAVYDAIIREGDH